MQEPSNVPVHRDDKNEATIPARFVRLPSIAEKKLGAAYTAPVRLDPRTLEQMQQTIKSLSKEYAHKLTGHIRDLLNMIETACDNTEGARDKFYDIIHDMRGLAGTFGHPIVGKFANSLCRYMEDSQHLNAAILRFHVEAMNDAVEDKMPDRRVVEETLRSLEQLILNAKSGSLAPKRAGVFR